jgi:hypothetical protein
MHGKIQLLWSPLMLSFSWYLQFKYISIRINVIPAIVIQLILSTLIYNGGTNLLIMVYSAYYDHDQSNHSVDFVNFPKTCV